MKKILPIVATIAAATLLLSCESQDRVRIATTEIEAPKPVRQVALNDDIEAAIQVASDTLRVSILSKSNDTYYSVVAIDSLQVGSTSTYPYYVEKILPLGKHHLQLATSKGHLTSEMKGDTLSITAEDVVSIFLYDFTVR